MKPFNRHLLIEPLDYEEEESLLILPDTYKALPQYMTAEILDFASDCKLDVEKEQIIVVDTSMIQHIEINGESHHIILENYVMGALD